MSSIQKLSIQGVRSFDNAERETIHFYTPLTLIVGHNGSGKTTIIECLRYATTGDLPPQNKGGAFIHDPRIAGEKEVMAQVKLGFTSTNGMQMICTRSMQLTMKKTTRTFKTLDGQLLVMHDGQRETISTRCAELDAQLPQFLGVSKAILDYVVFCHQDESLWPLSEPAVLKKRFDEIFEALKYTKALDTIKSLRKESATEIRLLQNDVDHLKNDKDRADKIRARADQLRSDIERTKEEATTLSHEMQHVEGQLNVLFKSGQEFQKVLSELDQKRAHLTALNDQAKELENTIEVLHDSDEELEKKKREFSQHIQGRQEELRELRNTIEKAKQELIHVRSKHSDTLVQEGKLNAEAEAHKDRLKKRQDLVKEIADRHNIAGFGIMDPDGRQIDAFREKLMATIRSCTNQVQRNKAEAEDQIGSIQSKIQQIREEKSSYEMRYKLSKNSNDKRQDDVRKLQASIDAAAVEEADIVYHTSQLKSSEQQLADQRAAFEQANFTAQQTEKADNLKDVERKLDAVSDELTRSNKQAEMRVNLGILHKNSNGRVEQLNALINTNGTRFKTYTGAELQRNTAEREFKDAQEKLQDALNEATRSHESCAKELSNIETRYSIVKSDLQKRSVERERSMKLFQDIVSPANGDTDYARAFQDCLQDAERTVERDRRNLNQCDFILAYYRKARDNAVQTHECNLCRRPLKDRRDEIEDSDDEGQSTELEVFCELMDAQIEYFGNKSQLVDRLEESEKILEEIRAAAPHVTKMQELDAVIPDLTVQLEQLETRLDTAGQEVEKATGEVEDVRRRMSELESLRKVVNDIVRFTSEILDMQLEIESYTSQLSDSGIGRSVDDIEAERQHFNGLANQYRRELTRITDERDLQRSQINVLENQVRDKKVVLNDKKNKLQAKNDLVSRVEELKQETAETLSKMEQVKTHINTMDPLLQSHAHDLEQTRAHFNKIESEKMKEVADLNTSMQKFIAIHADIEKYDYNGGDSRLAHAQQRTQKYANRMKKLVEETDQMMETANLQDRELISIGMQERQMSDNILLRSLRDRIEETQSRIHELEQKNAVQERNAFEKKAQMLRNHHARLNADYGSKVGEIKQMDDQLKRYEDELGTEFLNVHDTYRETLIKLKTTTASSEDLAKYGKALDSAIMKYHGMKMEEINRIIDELWKKTYSGTDVDTILIRSDDESAKGNRSYNYRVCMVKQDVELDMRGRCSAGQKVLASIIIRLALAECFGVNCGIIALDEPTTNLDQENVQSLARSLGSIIDTRRAQRNFQLIVITHDEDFLRYMNGSDYCEYYFRVSRNERQKSQIERQKISEVF
ncbi:AAA domain-containing protein [Lipomyces tetrasporus]|uniref:DNA repair protein RAD50 n=1 Tax=Lipomyces tetrasporus TaxID=54092 RepID=A0AAD7QWD1_9ASCO|nr:AAA domain-containing protein [Lipomyces tetrasporus]KAJ8102694.1 AAA domain-containing protein [Lipomyces tetrasporus]